MCQVGHKLGQDEDRLGQDGPTVPQNCWTMPGERAAKWAHATQFPGNCLLQFPWNCWVLGGFQGFSYGQVLWCFHMVPSWAKLGQDEHKLGQDEDSSPELLGTGWGTGSKKGTRDAVPRELARFLSRAQAVRTPLQFPWNCRVLGASTG